MPNIAILGLEGIIITAADSSLLKKAIGKNYNLHLFLMFFLHTVDKDCLT